MNPKDPHKPPPVPRSHWIIPKRPSSKRSWVILIACLCTLLFHLLLIVLFHFGLIGQLSRFSPTEKKPKAVYEIVLNDPDSARFVETNPYLAEQPPPPDTADYAAKSQIAAQEIATENLPENLTNIDGDLEELSKIVPDQLVPFDDLTLTELADLKPDFSPQTDLPTLEIKEQKLDTDGPKIALRPQPKPRKSVKPLVGGMRKSSGGVKNIGVTAVDARFNQFGVYRQRMHEAIGYQWYLLMSNYSPTNEDCNTRVRISYTIDQTGTIKNLEVKDSSASNLLTLLCKDSILSLACFGDWNDDMIKILGKEQTFHVGFIIR